jgi:hypothetical protein
MALDGNAPCGDSACYRGTIDRSGVQYKDGPCGAPNCQWPANRPTRQHFTDTPSAPIIDAGAVAMNSSGAGGSELGVARVMPAGVG